MKKQDFLIKKVPITTIERFRSQTRKEKKKNKDYTQAEHLNTLLNNK